MSEYTGQLGTEQSVLGSMVLGAIYTAPVVEPVLTPIGMLNYTVRGRPSTQNSRRPSQPYCREY